MNRPKPVVLAILDGWGYAEAGSTNAVSVADTPNMDGWMTSCPFTTLAAHNGVVGLPEGQMGNSEVGHLNIGAGRIVYQDFTRINLSITQGDFFANAALCETMGKVLATGGALHLFGLVSDGGVHSHLDHLAALLEMARRQGLTKVFVHAFMDGRDTPPKSGAGFMRDLAEILERIGIGEVAVVSGRYYAMDRDNRWPRVERAWQALVDGEGLSATDPVTAVEDAYARGENDEFIQPVVLRRPDGTPVATVDDGDAVIFFNFRADRARQLTYAFVDPLFKGFVAKRIPRLASYLTFTEYDHHFNLPVAFPPVSLDHILGQEVSAAGLAQLRIAETEKYAHVTYFFNGGSEEPFAGEDRALIPSPREVATYDQKPEMSALLVTEELLSRIAQNRYDFIVLNFANGDMVGHSGNLRAAVKACETVDSCLGRLIALVRSQGGVTLITSDHGNAEQMTDPVTGQPHTAHTCNPVPLILVGDGYDGVTLRSGGALKDIAPTLLHLMGLPVPPEMGGENLIERSV